MSHFHEIVSIDDPNHKTYLKVCFVCKAEAKTDQVAVLKNFFSIDIDALRTIS
jgi:hypothetical protein